MSFALVLFHEIADGAPVSVPPAELAALRDVLARVPALEEALVFTPAAARDQYVDDGPPPPLGVQLHFPRLEALEAAAAHEGILQELASVLPSLSGTQATAQAFWRRQYPVDDTRLRVPTGALPCSYVVHYPGPAADLNAWLDHYRNSHPPLFRRFPGIRGIEILTRVDWIGHLPHRRVDHMQRNRVMFDSPEALTAALQSPVRHELRADFHRFPPFEGGNAHFPMWTERVMAG